MFRIRISLAILSEILFNLLIFLRVMQENKSGCLFSDIYSIYKDNMHICKVTVWQHFVAFVRSSIFKICMEHHVCSSAAIALCNFVVKWHIFKSYCS